MIYRVRALANLRHYQAHKNEEFEVEVDGPMSVAELLEHLGIPSSEVMLVKVGERVVKKDLQLEAGALIELLPILCGG